MTAKEILYKYSSENEQGIMFHSRDILKAMQEFAESLAKERAVEFAEYIDQKYQLMIDGSIEENFDTFLAEKRKEGAE